LLLGSRKLDACAIAGQKAFGIDLHLFALDAGREAEHSDDEIGVACGIERLRLLTAGQAPNEPRFRETDVLKVFDLERVRMALLQMNAFRHGVGGAMQRPVFHDESAIEPDAEAILTSEAEEKVAGFGRD
jgi:hypothetical protein